MPVRTINTPPPSGRVAGQPGIRTGSTVRTGHTGSFPNRVRGGWTSPSDSSTYWNGYDYSQAPVYPDTSFSAYRAKLCNQDLEDFHRL